MFKILMDGLVRPSHLAINVKAGFGKMWLYIFFIVFLFSLPSIIATSVQLDFNHHTNNAIFGALRGPLRTDNEIVDGRLIMNNNQSLSATVGEYVIILNSQSPMQASTFVVGLNYDSMSLYLLTFNVASYTFLELGLQNYDFSDVSITNMLIFSNAVNILYRSNLGAVKSIEVLFNLTSRLVEVLFIILFITLLTFVPIPFSQKYKINAYVATIYLFFVMLATLFSFSLLTFVGLLLFFIYSRRAFFSIIIKRN